MSFAPQRRSIVLGIVLAALSCPVRGQVPAQIPKDLSRTHHEPVVNISLDGPKNVAADEIAGRVVDAKGKPVAGVLVDIDHLVPNYRETTTDEDGVFRFKKVDRNQTPHIRLRPENFAWQEFLQQTAGTTGWTVALKDDTRFEGRVLDCDGKPVPHASVVADAHLTIIGEHNRATVTEVKTGPDGTFRLFVAPGQFEITVRVPGVGTARTYEKSTEGKAKTLDLKLYAGVTFLAQCLDHDTGEPVPGVTLSHGARIRGASDDNGLILIQYVLPGRYPHFSIEAKGYARWWSPQCASKQTRFLKGQGFQANFDWLDFDLTPTSGPVTIELEREVTIRGRVLDPDAKPVKGATVTPAKTGIGTSLFGDSRFMVRTDTEGRYECVMPASGVEDFNLMAHDGEYDEWRTWANGVSAAMMTRPGQVKKDFDLKLSRPATVMGRVVDSKGKPVAGREVRSQPTALDENGYFDPTTMTDKDGKFTLKFVRPGENHLQVAPFMLFAKDAPAGTSKVVTAKAGEVVGGVDLIAQSED